MANDSSFIVKFWGVRGTIPVPGPSSLRYGGNTSCIELRCGEHIIILDAGSGLKPLGDALKNKQVDILLSHTHIDHVIGLPFFIPAYHASQHIRLWAGHLTPESSIRQVVGQMMCPPLFPLTPDDLSAKIDYNDFTAGSEVTTPEWKKAGIRVRTLPLPHPDRATGYRIEFAGKSVCYITDYEHEEGKRDETLIEFIRGTDCFIFDSTYTDEEYASYKGWGHSTWEQGLRIAEAAGVKRLVTFHHNPDVDDRTLDARFVQLKARHAESLVAREGMEIELCAPFSITTNPDTEYSVQDALKLVNRLTGVGMALSSENNLDNLLEIILVEAKSIAHADGGTLYYLTDDEHLEFAIVRNDTLGISIGGLHGQKTGPEPVRLYDATTGAPNYGTQAVFATLMKKSINIPDVYTADGFDFNGSKAFDAKNNYRTQSVLTIPMVSHKQEVIGCLQLINAKDPLTGLTVPFSTNTQNVVQSLASQAAIILENKKLVQAQTNLLESFIEMIAKAIDAKSPYTGQHCERVPTLTDMMAEAACEATDGFLKDFTMSDEEKYELHIAGWMHDCGKVTTPVHVMDKATKLETIFDRIELVKTRFELLKREARIEMLEAQAKPGADNAALTQAYEQKVQRIDEDMAFIERANIGGEFMSDEHLANLQRIAQDHIWSEGGKQHAGLSENELYNLSIRRGTLTSEERTIMNDHMVHTCNMLEALPFPKHLQRVPEYAGGHHERMDGKGYPRGIMAGSMSIPARMMAVADVFEALTAGDRPYKKAKKLSEAMGIIGHMKRDHHLDPDIVDFFITSKVYLAYAHKYLEAELIDEIDEAALLAIKPTPLK